MINKLTPILEYLKKFPSWIRAILLLLIACLLFFLSSCGQTVRVTVRDTDHGVSITTSQTKKDTSGTNININPIFNK